jgi:SAM-dependent methyltransferase
MMAHGPPNDGRSSSATNALTTEAYWDNFFEQTYRPKAKTTGVCARGSTSDDAEARLDALLYNRQMCSWYLPAEVIVDIILAHCSPLSLSPTPAVPLVAAAAATTTKSSSSSSETSTRPLLPPPANCRVLHLGAGNAPLPFDLIRAGFRDVENVDFSFAIVAAMNVHCERLVVQWHTTSSSPPPRVRYQRCDAKSLTPFSDASFDVLIEKGTLDCVHLGGAADIVIMLQSCSRVMRDGGVFFLVSVHGPVKRVPELLGRDGSDGSDAAGGGGVGNDSGGASGGNGGGGGGGVGGGGVGNESDGGDAGTGSTAWSPRYGWSVEYRSLPYVPPEAPTETCTHMYIMRRRRSP